MNEPIKQPPDTRPRIMVSTRWVDGEMQIGTLPLGDEPILLQRCGRLYIVNQKGIQRRVK